MQKKRVLIWLLLSFILMTVVNFKGNQVLDHYPDKALTSSVENYANINSTFSDKLDKYATYEVFPQIYEPSLRATYFALSTLDALGKLEQVNEPEIIDYIMSNYDKSAHLFIDQYASRYLDTDFSLIYYPLYSLLEVNCYAILSLNLFDALNLIDIGELINFIWSCYNPFTSGFIGQPFDSSLEYEFLISTLDNTYFAIKTLDLLMPNWIDHNRERTDLIQYINDRQNFNSGNWRFGGFANDNESYYYSLATMDDINMFSAYYAIKSLEIFGMEGSINHANFYQFLNSLYNADNNFFTFIGMQQFLDYNIVVSSMGMELSVITGFEGYDHNAVLNFILANQNTLGIWDSSSETSAYELIDTFQIIRSLDTIGNITALGHSDTTQIATTLLTYFLNDKGFTPLSLDCPTMTLYHDIISAFNLFGRLSELDLSHLYSALSQSYYERTDSEYCGFVEYSPEFYNFRSFPIEFYRWGSKNLTENVKMAKSHKATYHALRSLKTIFKLDDFGQQYSLNFLLDDILGSQFLNSSYLLQFGGFLPYGTYTKFISLGSTFIERMSKSIFFEYTYFAIKALELLTEQLDIGDITFLDLDFNSLISHIENFIIETPKILYFKPRYTNNMEIILENTFYMVDLLKTIDMYDLNSQKIENFILLNLDYANIKCLYYSYRLAEILNLDIEFDIGLTQNLVQNIFSDEFYEFCYTPEMHSIGQEIFLWICEMASGSNLKIRAERQEEAMLGSHTVITSSLANMILSYFDYDLKFSFDSTQLGNHEFEKVESNKFFLKLFIPQNPNNYPSVSGKIVAYDIGVKLTEQLITLVTVYPARVFQDEIKGTIILSVLFFVIPGSVIILSERKLKKGKFKVD